MHLESPQTQRRLWNGGRRAALQNTLETAGSGNRFLVSSSNTSDSANLSPNLDYLGVSFYYFEPPLTSSKQELPVRGNKVMYAS